MAGGNDYTRAFSLNPNGTWVGGSAAGLAAVYGQVNQTTPTVLAGLDGSAANTSDIADNGTKVVTVVPFAGGSIEARVYRPDNTFVTLVNPFASEGSTEMFGQSISEDANYVLCNVRRYNSVTETWDLVSVVFSGPNWSQWTAATLADGTSFIGQGMDIENSGTVTILAADGIYLWKPGQAPHAVAPMVASVNPQTRTFRIAFQAGNPTVEKGGATFIAGTDLDGAAIIRIGERTTPMPSTVEILAMPPELTHFDTVDVRVLSGVTTVEGVGDGLGADGRQDVWLVTIPQGGAASMQALSGFLSDSDLVVHAIDNSMIVGGEVSYSPVVGIALGWLTSNPGQPVDLSGSEGRAFDINGDGVVVLNTGGTFLAASGPFGGTVTVFAGSSTVVAVPTSISDLGTRIVTTTGLGVNGLQTEVYSADGSAFILPNPFPNEAESLVFGTAITEDDSFIVANVGEWDPITEVTRYHVVLYFGAGFQQFQVEENADGSPFYGWGMDVEIDGRWVGRNESGQAVYALPGQSPQLLADFVQSQGATVPQGGFSSANEGVLLDGTYYIAVDGVNRTYLVSVIGSDEPPVPPLTITGTAGKDKIVLDLGDHPQTSEIIIDTLGGADSVTIVGVAARPVRIVIRTGAGNDKVTIEATGEVTVEAELGAGNDRYVAMDSTAMSIVYGGDGNDKITGSSLFDMLFGELGNDVLKGLGRGDTLDGGAGRNKIIP
jgi:hypothetical protein